MVMTNLNAGNQQIAANIAASNASIISGSNPGASWTTSSAPSQAPTVVPPTTGNPLDGQSQALLAQFQQILRDYGLEELAPWLASTAGMSQAEFILALEEQEAYRRRFRAIFERREAGLPPVSADYILAYEAQVAQRAQFYGIDASRFDAQEFIINDVSEAEFEDRLAMVAQIANEEMSLLPEDQVAEFRDLYGLSQGDLMEYIMFGEDSVPKLQQKIQAAGVAAGAERSGFGQLTAAEAEMLAQEGLSLPEATQGFEYLSYNRQLLGRIYGEEDIAGFDRNDQIRLAAGDPNLLRRLADNRERRLAMSRGAARFSDQGVGLSGLGTAN